MGKDCWFKGDPVTLGAMKQELNHRYFMADSAVQTEDFMNEHCQLKFNFLVFHHISFRNVLNRYSQSQFKATRSFCEGGGRQNSEPMARTIRHPHHFTGSAAAVVAREGGAPNGTIGPVDFYEIAFHRHEVVPFYGEQLS